MTGEYSQVNVPLMYKFINAGAGEQLKQSTGSTASRVGSMDMINEELPSSAPDADRYAVATYDGTITDQMPDFSVMLQVIAPFLIKFSKLVRTVEDYLERQIGQIKFLITLLSVTYVSAFVLVTLIVYEMFSKLPTRQMQAMYIGITMIIAVIVHGVITTWNRMLSERMQVLQGIDLSVIIKYDKMLGSNVYVQYADAYARGVHDQFSKENARRKFEEEEQTEGDPVFDACKEGGGRGTSMMDMRDCVIDPCEPPTLEDALHDQFRKAWANRKHPKACSRAIIMMLEALRDIHTGTVFESKDRNAMWHIMRERVDGIREVILRHLDIRDRDYKSSHRTNLELVKDDILPKLKLDVVETHELKPRMATGDGSEEVSENHFNRGVRSRAQCWKMAMEDQHCRWAYYVPGRGGLFATTRDCNDASGGCINPYRTVLLYDPIPRGEQRDLESETLLVKRDPGGPGSSKHETFTYVCARGAAKDLFTNWTKLPDLPQKGGVSRVPACDDLVTCDAYSLQSSFQRGRGEKEETWTANGADNRSYTELFDPGADKAANSTLFCVKTSPDLLFRKNSSRYMAATFFTLATHLEESVVEMIKRHPRELNIMDYADYIHTEMEGYFTPPIYAPLKSLIDDLLRRIVRTLERLFSGTRTDYTYIPLTRFEEKLSSMEYVDARELVENAGQLARVTKLYMSSYPHESSNVANELLLTVSSTIVLCLLVGLVAYNANRIMCYHAGQCSGDSVMRGVGLSLAIFVFVVVIMASVIMRISTRASFNNEISRTNGRHLIMSTTMTMKLSTHLLEAKAQRDNFVDNITYQEVKQDFVQLYRSFGYTQGADELEKGDMRKELPDMRLLYRNMRQVVQAYDSCNSLVPPKKLPFPTYEMVVYSVIILIIIAILLYSYYMLDPAGKITNIGKLKELETNIKAGLPPPQEFKEIIRCCQAPTETWSLVMNLVAVLLIMLTFFIVYTIVRASNTYRMGLYASALYTNNRCTP